MTLFVDCVESKFGLLPEQPFGAKDDILVQKEADLFAAHFADRPFHAYAVRNSPYFGNAVFAYRLVSNDCYLVMIRSTKQATVPLILRVQRSALGKLPLVHSLSRNAFRAKQILELLGDPADSPETVRSIESIKGSKVNLLITQMDSVLVPKQFKFGVAYLDRFDTTEAQMLQNTREDCSEAFERFLQRLGRVIELRGWKGYSGGLDTSNEALSGEVAVYNDNLPDGKEALFHVAPWLPGGSYNNVERKRHFGNDTVVIVFSESLYTFDLSSLLSRQTQVVFYIRPQGRLNRCQVHVFAKELIPFRTHPGTNPYHLDTTDSRAFNHLLNDLIEAELACYRILPLSKIIRDMRAYKLDNLVKNTAP